MAIKVSGTEVISDDKRILNNENLPDIRPSLLLDFANSKTLDPRITFTRVSTASYYDGVTTAKAEENLLRYSQDVSNAAWSKSGTTITANNTAAPDGTTTADLILPTTSSSTKSIFQTGLTVYGDNTQSVYAKANGYTKIALRESDSGAYVASFNLAASGSVTANSNCTATITDVGNGWFRLTMTGNRTGATRWSTYILNPSSTNYNDSTDWSGDGTSGIYVWGAQLEERSSATAYTPTTSAPIVKYQPVLQTAASGEARFDHDPVTGESKGLLIEEARTNLVKYSGDLNAATANTGHGWLFGSTLSSFFSYIPAQKIAPDGTQTGVEFVSTASTSEGLFLRTDGLTFGASTYTASMWVYVPTQTGVNNWGMRVDFGDTESTTVDNVTLFDQWYRISVTVTTSATRNFLDFGIRYNSTVPDNDDFFKFYVWGAQVEQGSFPTSYIPTFGSTVTRAADSASITGTNFSSFFNQNEGTVYLDYRTEQKTANFRVLSVSDNSTNNRMEFAIASGSGNGPYSFFVREGSNQVDNSGGYSYTASTNFKVATGYKTDDTSFSNNGETPVNDTSCLIPTVDRLYIGADGVDTSASKPCCSIRKLAYYPKRLPNATLQAMTEA